MWLGLGLLLLVLLAAALGVLAVPVDLTFRGRCDALAGELSGRLRVEWLDGRLGRDLPLRGRRREPREKSETRRRRRFGREHFRILWQQDFRARVRELLGRWRAWTRIERLQGRARVGLGDPADTGMAMGLILPLVEVARGLPAVDLQVAPDFGDTCLSGELDGAVRTVPLGLLVPLTLFALQPATLRTWRRLRALEP